MDIWRNLTERGGLHGSNLPASAGAGGDGGSIPGPGRAPGGGNGNPLQYACLENPRTEEPAGLQSTVLPMESQSIGHD